MFSAAYFEVSNMCLILLSEGEDKLGTLAIAAPQPKGLVGPPTSSIILGDRHTISARIFAEFFASKKKKISLASVYTETVNEGNAQPIFMKLVGKLLERDNGVES
jgi:hypothetical protein